MIMRCHHWIHIRHISMLSLKYSRCYMSFKQKEVTSVCVMRFTIPFSVYYSMISILIHSWKQMCLFILLHLWVLSAVSAPAHTFLSSVLQDVRNYGSNKSTLVKWRGIWAFVSKVLPIVLQNFHQPSLVWSDSSNWTSLDKNWSDLFMLK